MTAPSTLSAPRGRERATAGSGLTGTTRLLRLAARRDRVTCTVGGDDLGRLLEVLGTHGITALTSAPPTLEELFMEQYRVPAATP